MRVIRICINVNVNANKLIFRSQYGGVSRFPQFYIRESTIKLKWISYFDLSHFLDSHSKVVLARLMII